MYMRAFVVNNYVKQFNRFLSGLLLFFIITAIFCVMSGCGRKVSTENVPEYVFVYAENQSNNYPTTRGAYKFAQLVDEKTGGRIKIIVKCNSELGDEKSIVEQLEFEGVDFARVSVASISDNIPKLKVIQMPYLYSGEAAMWDVLDGDIGAEFTQAIQDSSCGIRALSWYDAGARNFYSVKPLADMSDLNGLNIRVQESDVMYKTVQLLGANPVKMSYSEVYKALQTGKIDGAENNWSSYEYSGHYEQAKYCLIDEHIRIPEVQLISQKTWNKLSEEDKNIISDCAKESAIYERNLWKMTDNAAKRTVIDKDVTVTKISEEQREYYREKLQPLYDEYCSDYMDIIEKIRNVQNED